MCPQTRQDVQSNYQGLTLFWVYNYYDEHHDLLVLWYKRASDNLIYSVIMVMSIARTR